ncbi:hypothetical protein C8Q76DRAFT_288857 [Earliella scabrosa]|nr:hypothetical protein C8Q76DRAFT_288857 [Earliella scabrosa]
MGFPIHLPRSFSSHVPHILSYVSFSSSLLSAFACDSCNSSCLFSSCLVQSGPVLPTARASAASLKPPFRCTQSGFPHLKTRYLPRTCAHGRAARSSARTFGKLCYDRWWRAAYWRAPWRLGSNLDHERNRLRYYTERLPVFSARRGGGALRWLAVGDGRERGGGWCRTGWGGRQHLTPGAGGPCLYAPCAPLFSTHGSTGRATRGTDPIGPGLCGRLLRWSASIRRFYITQHPASLIPATTTIAALYALPSAPSRLAAVRAFFLAFTLPFTSLALAPHSHFPYFLSLRIARVCICILVRSHLTLPSLTLSVSI